MTSDLNLFDASGGLSSDWVDQQSGALSNSVSNFDPNPFPNAAPNTNGLNSASGNDTSFLSDVWDEAKKTFNTVLTTGASVYQAQALANLQTAQAQQQLANKQALNPPYTASQRYTISLASVGAVVLLGAAYFLMQRRR